MDLLSNTQKDWLKDSVDDWLEPESPLVVANCQQFLGRHQSPLDSSEPWNPSSIFAEEVDLPGFLVSNIPLCQPVGTLPLNPVCMMSKVASKQRATVSERERERESRLLGPSLKQPQWESTDLTL